MEGRSWRWTDAHFCTLPSQTNVYGHAKILDSDGANKFLIASLVGKIFSVEYQRIFDKLTPFTREIQFTYIPGDDTEINAVDALSHCSHGKRLIIAIAFTKTEDNESKQFLNLYTPSQYGEEFNMENVAEECRLSLELYFVPYQLTHTEMVSNNGRETVFLLSGSDGKIHLFRECNSEHIFIEEDSGVFFPEFIASASCVHWLDIVYIDNYTRRLTAMGHQCGLLIASIVDVQKLEILRTFTVDYDSPITYVHFFTSHNEVSCPKFLKSFIREQRKMYRIGQKEEDERNPQVPEYHLLALSALEPAIVYEHVLQHGFTHSIILPDSNKFDAILCGSVTDIDFDGENEILIGTYGQELIAYKLNHSKTQRSRDEVNLSTDSCESKKIWHYSSDKKTTDPPSNPIFLPPRRVRSQESFPVSLESDNDRSFMDTKKELCASLKELPKNRSDMQAVEEGCLLWQRSFAYPVIGINKLDIMGDGMEDLIVVTLKGVHVLQPDLHEVAKVCLDRLQMLTDENPDKKEKDSCK
ncbi:hypothetical protein CHS0354_034585 [Potamilus streckersoni]|uniref:Kaptin n=1 Tax=Potamilus streckersoni TaxID=2493646 RepID=A0AAE0SSY3_9BIVA|nr:hypothetical protein CHS0354_034585 [Potamilus streckersoni]